MLLSIILGLAITQILLGFRALILARERVRFGAPTLIWCVILLVLFAQSWWTMFGLRDHTSWTFGEFAVILAQVILQYLLAAIVLPEVPTTGDVDLPGHYANQQRWFFAIAILVAATSLAKDGILDGHLPDLANVGFHLAFIAACVAAALVRARGFALLNAVVVAAGIGAYIVALFAKLG